MVISIGFAIISAVLLTVYGFVYAFISLYLVFYTCLNMNVSVSVIAIPKFHKELKRGFTVAYHPKNVRFPEN